MWCLLVQNPIFFFLFSEQNSTSFLKLHMILNLVDDPVIYCIGLSLVSCINKFSNAATYLKILRVLGSYAKKRHTQYSHEDPLSKSLLTCVWTNKIEEEIISTHYFEWSSIDNSKSHNFFCSAKNSYNAQCILLTIILYNFFKILCNNYNCC